MQKNPVRPLVAVLLAVVLCITAIGGDPASAAEEPPHTTQPADDGVVEGTTERAYPTVSMPHVYAYIIAAGSWTNGSSYGGYMERKRVCYIVCVSVPAGYAFNLYRSARKALYVIYAGLGIRMVQDLIWHFGAPPVYKVCVDALHICYSIHQIRVRFHDMVYVSTQIGGNAAADLSLALRGAQASAHCLKADVFMQTNWSHTGDSCKIGTLPS
jgi:hypothetical protein